MYGDIEVTDEMLKTGRAAIPDNVWSDGNMYNGYLVAAYRVMRALDPEVQRLLYWSGRATLAR